jgi:chloride channel 3/4/5
MRDAYANESEDDDPVSNYERDEAIFAEDPSAQNDPGPYVLSLESL